MGRRITLEGSYSTLADIEATVATIRTLGGDGATPIKFLVTRQDHKLGVNAVEIDLASQATLPPAIPPRPAVPPAHVDSRPLVDSTGTVELPGEFR